MLCCQEALQAWCPCTPNLQLAKRLGSTEPAPPVSRDLWLPSWHSWFQCCPGCHLGVAESAPYRHPNPAWGILQLSHLHFGFEGWPERQSGGGAALSMLITYAGVLWSICFSLFIFFFYLILNARHSICCSLTPGCCNIYGLAGNTPNRKHVLPVGRDNPRVWNVNDSLVFLPSRYGSQHLPSIWARQLNGWHICRLGAQSKVTLTGTDHTSNRETVTPLSFRLDHSLAIVYQSGLDSETVQMHERNKWSTGRSRSCSI